MKRIAIKGLLARKWRLAMAALSITLGVGFIVGTLVLTDTMSRSFDELFADAGRGVDTYVRGNDDLGERPRVPQASYDTLKALPGVASVEGRVSGSARLIGPDNKPLGNAFSSSGASWAESGAFSIVDGRAPSARGEVALDRATMRKHNLSIGNTVRAELPVGSESFQVVGAVRFGSSDSVAGSTMLFFSIPEAQRVFDAGGSYNGLALRATPPTTPAQLKSAVSSALNDRSIEVLTGEELTKESKNDIKQGLRFFTIFLSIFGVIALFVGSFIIYNTFAILVAQRQRETALLRAVGATSGQVLRAVVLEAVAVGVAAAAAGVAFGLAVAAGLRAAFDAFGVDLPATGLVLRPARAVTAVLIGVLIATIASWLPARRAAKTPPVAALRSTAIEGRALTVKRIAFGGLLTAGSILLLVGGVSGRGGSAAGQVGASFAIAILAVATLGPILARPGARLVGLPLRLRGVTGQLARENAMRSPRRTASTALALTIGVAVVGFILVLAASFKGSINRIIDNQIRADYVVTSEGQPFSPAVAERISKLPGVKHVSGLQFGDATIDGKVEALTAIDPATIDELYKVDTSAGRIADLSPTSIGVAEKTATRRGWKVGDIVNVSFAKTGSQALRIATIYDGTQTQGSNFLISRSAFATHFTQQLDVEVYVKAASPEAALTLRSALDDALREYPSLSLNDRAEYKALQAKNINQLVAIIYVLLFMSILIALLGIANTIALSIHERRRELGLLRAVGMTRQQVRSAVHMEAWIISVLGALIGVGIGTGFGIAVLQPLRSIGLGHVTVPSVSLVIVTLTAGAAGVVASLRPARRAAKLDVLAAIAE